MMLRNKKASDIANAIVDDGDDIHITSSFRASEENSSIVGNASCLGSGILQLRNPKSDSDDDSTESVQSIDATEAEEVKDLQPTDRRDKFKVLRALSFTKRLRRADLSLPWRLNSFLVRPMQSRALREYQEMIEQDAPLSPAASDVASYAETLKSMRSSRINVATGRTLLVRQKAQVVGRPSVAQADWDIGSSISSYTSSASSSAGSSRKIGMKRSLSWDNTSCGARSDVSQLTGDSFRSKRSDFTSARGMFVHPEISLLETTEEVDEHDFEIANDENVAPNRVRFQNRKVLESRVGFSPGKATSLQGAARKVVNRLLWEAKTEFQELNDWDAFATIAEEHSESSSCDRDEIRARAFSDSDFVFEMQRQRHSMDGCRVDEFGFHLPSPRETIVSDICRSRAYSDSFRPHHIFENDVETSTARARCASENYVAHFDLESSIGVQHIEDFDFDKGVAFEEFELPRVQNTSKPNLVDPFQRLLISQVSDQNRRRSQEAPESIPLLNQIEISKTHRRLSSYPESTGVNAFNNCNLTHNSWRGWNDGMTSEQASSASGDASREMTDRTAVISMNRTRQDIDPCRVLQPVQRGLSSPTAASAAKLIASALRPPGVSSCSAVGVSDHQNYYWNDDSDEEASDEVLWVLSAEESFETLF